MKKFNTSPVSGTEEFLPETQRIFDTYLEKIRSVYRQNAYLSVETPLIERTEVLLKKAGGDTEKQIYKLIKTSEDPENSSEALRFDHTVPLARYVVEHENSLHFPLKVSQIGPSFRGERAQRGRFREFIQADIDILGRGSLDEAYDFVIISTLNSALTSLEIPGVFVRLSSRRLWNTLFSSLGIESHAEKILSIIDHSEKVPESVTLAAFNSLSLSEDTTSLLQKILSTSGPLNSVSDTLKALPLSSPEFSSALDSLLALASSLSLSGVDTVVDLRIVRGLDYYTGTVFEFALRDFPEIGSVAGGGRYANLTSYFSDQKFEGVGGSIGFSRLFFALREKNLLPAPSLPVDYAFIPISPDDRAFAFSLAQKTREKGLVSDTLVMTKPLGDRLSYASKIAKYAVVIGENEQKTGEIIKKDLISGEKSPFSLDSL